MWPLVVAWMASTVKEAEPLASKARENRIEWEENNVEMMKMYTAKRRRA